MSILDSFINYIRHIKNKLVRMVKGKKKISDEEWDTVSDKLLEFIKRDFAGVEERFKDLTKKANIRELEKKPKKIKERNIYSYIIGIPILLFFCSFIVKEEFTQILYSYWIHQIFPILLFSILGCIPYMLGKTTEWAKMLYFICVFINILHIGIFLIAGNFSINLSWGSEFMDLVTDNLFYGTFAYVVAFLLIREIVKPQRTIKIKKNDFIYLKSNSDIESIIEIMVNSIYYHVEGIRKIIPLKEEEGIAIWDIGEDMRIFLSYIDNILSFIVLKQEGRYIKQDELCKKTQKEIVYVLKNVLDFSKYQGKSTNDLYLNQGNAFKEYTELSELKSIWKKYSREIVLSIIATLVILGCWKREELPEALLSYLQTILIIILTIINIVIYLYFFKPKSSR